MRISLIVGAMALAAISSTPAHAGWLCSTKYGEEYKTCERDYEAASKRYIETKTEEAKAEFQKFFDDRVVPYRSMDQIENDIAIDNALSDLRRARGSYEGRLYLRRSRGY